MILRGLAHGARSILAGAGGALWRGDCAKISSAVPSESNRSNKPTVVPIPSSKSSITLKKQRVGSQGRHESQVCELGDARNEAPAAVDGQDKDREVARYTEYDV